MTTVLVTGGAGFIGSHVVDKLISEKYKVIVFDNLSSGKETYLNPKAEFIKGDVTKVPDIEKVFVKRKIDVVMHIAGQPSIVTSFTDPAKDFETNFTGTMNVVMQSLKHNIKRFLYASSMTVYGNQQKLPISETAACVPINYYGIAKYAAERFVHSTAERIDLETPFNVTSFRMFNVYGPRQSLTNPYQGVLAIFIGNVLRGEPIIIFGDGKNARDFVYIDDVADAWVTAIDNKKSFGKVINIGSGKMIDVNNLAKTVIAVCGKNSKKYPVLRKPDRPGNQKYVEADITLAKKLLSFNTRYPFELGLLETLAWARLQN